MVYKDHITYAPVKLLLSIFVLLNLAVIMIGLVIGIFICLGLEFIEKVTPLK